MKKKYNEILKDVESFYDEVGLKYDIIYPNIIESNKKIAESLKNQGLIRDDLIIADLACGSGWLLHEIHKLVPLVSLHGFDISKESILLANRKIIDGSISFHVADWLNLESIVNNKLDVALCIGNSLTHFPVNIQRKILFTFSKLIKNGGSLIVDSYADWNQKLNGHYEIEPKGLKKFEGGDVVSYFFSVYTKKMAERNICFATYNNDIGKSFVELVKFERYVTYQFPFAIKNAKLNKEKFGFSKIDKIAISDGIDIFEYYRLLK
ncbi:class I SAM-dependent methyltransferase [Methylobacter sp. Wu8]|uniref:class I SAM-dependent methyltransferase n=1 Tax=Methylobacter sp. Wu8 TaxID=3118457 RepID=UPI002F2C3BE6